MFYHSFTQIQNGKKFLLLSILIFFFSCFTDEQKENEGLYDGPIIGSWSYQGKIYYPADGSEEIFMEATDCVKQSRLTFNSDGTLNNITYGHTNAGCELNDRATENGTPWMWLDDNQLKIGSGNISSIRDEVIFPDESTMIFKDFDPSTFRGEEMTGNDEVYLRVN